MYTDTNPGPVAERNERALWPRNIVFLGKPFGVEHLRIRIVRGIVMQRVCGYDQFLANVQSQIAVGNRVLLSANPVQNGERWMHSERFYNEHLQFT